MCSNVFVIVKMNTSSATTKTTITKTTSTTTMITTKTTIANRHDKTKVSLSLCLSFSSLAAHSLALKHACDLDCSLARSLPPLRLCYNAHAVSCNVCVCVLVHAKCAPSKQALPLFRAPLLRARFFARCDDIGDVNK